MIRTLLLLALLAAVPQVSKHKKTDTVTLTGGKELVGRVIYEDAEKILLRTGSKKPREIAIADTVSVLTLERSLREFVDRYDAADKSDPDSMAEVARFAEERGLATEARLAWATAIFADEEYKPAYERMKARDSSKKGWQFRIGKKWRSLEEAKAISGKWKDRWEIETTHFVIRTDLPVERLPSLAVNVERFYLEYYRVMRQVLPLYEFDLLPAINLYLQDGAMPTPPVPAEAWFDLTRNELDVQVTENRNLPFIISELSRLMMFNTLRGTIGRVGNTMPWLVFGQADVFGAAVVDADGALELDFDRLYLDSFKRHAEAENPFPIKRIVNMGWGDILTGTNHELARAQTYTLTHFLIFGENEQFRTGYGEYLKQSFVGKSAEKDLVKALGLKSSKELEDAWLEYVKAKAGV